MKRSLILLAAVTAAFAADLPVTQVVLYKHGVGFFERSGKLAAGESARLEFSVTEMNDVLKSLTIEERGGGKISGLRYDAQDPLSHQLAEFPFRIGDAQPLSVMLDQLKGARIEVKIGSETVAGLIVTGREVEATDKQPGREQLTLLLDNGELRTLDLSAASGLRLSDATLQKQFQEYLAAVAAARSKEKRSVYIDSTSAPSRELLASYTIPTAVWKSSYRLIFGSTAQPTLEGWAIVDNTTGEDWNNVQLSLVSGRPISFVSQLYAPRYVQRPTAELAEDRAAQPVVHEGAFDYEGVLTNGTGQGNGAGGVGGRGGGGGGGGGGNQPMAARAMAAPAPMLSMNGGLADASAYRQNLDRISPSAAPSTIVSSASAQELGELFEYRIGQPVTIRKSESAMLPFLQQQIDGRKLLIYSDHNSQHPTNAAELTNNSGKTLDGGPITVYDGGAYGGEALMETLKTGDKRLVSYAVDLGTRITEAFGSKAAIVREIHANRGVVTTKMAAEETRSYTIRNVDDKAKTLILEHPLRPAYTLLNQKPTEKTASAYRFEIRLGASSSQEFAVNEERVYDQTYSVSNLTPGTLAEYAGNVTISPSGRTQLQRIAERKSRIAENDRALADVRSQTSDLLTDEEHIRRNIESLNNVSGQQQQVQNYAKQIDDRERQLATQRDRQAELQKQKDALDADLANLIEALQF